MNGAQKAQANHGAGGSLASRENSPGGPPDLHIGGGPDEDFAAKR